MNKILILLAILLATGPLGWSQALVDGVQPSAVNGVTVATGTAIDGITLTAPGGGSPSHTFVFENAGLASGCSGTSCATTLGFGVATDVMAIGVYTTDNVTVSSVSGCGTTWTTGTNSNFHSFISGFNGVNLAFSPSLAGPCTSLTVTLSASDPNWSFNVDAWTVTGSGAATVDQLASTNTNTTACTSCTASGFTGLTGTNDLFVQFTDFGGTFSSLSSPYAYDSDDAFAYALNSTSGTAPVLTQSSAQFLSLGVAIQ